MTVKILTGVDVGSLFFPVIVMCVFFFFFFSNIFKKYKKGLKENGKKRLVRGKTINLK